MPEIRKHTDGHDFPYPTSALLHDSNNPSPHLQEVSGLPHEQHPLLFPFFFACPPLGLCAVLASRKSPLPAKVLSPLGVSALSIPAIVLLLISSCLSLIDIGRFT